MITAILLNGLWQGALLLAAASLVAAAVPRHSAATRCAIWFATLVALAIVPVASTAWHPAASEFARWPVTATTANYRITLIPAAAEIHGAGAWFSRLAPWLLALWSAGVFFNLVRLAVSLVRAAQIRTGARPLESGPRDVFVSAAITVPLVAGIVRPRILLPEGLTGSLDPADLQRIVAHERAHVARRDTVLNLIARTIEAVLFFNPWVRFANAALVREREIACDDYVVAADGNAAGYARCLAALAQRRVLAPMLTPSAFGSRSALIARLGRLRSARARRLSINTYALGGMVVFFAVATLALQAFTPAVATPMGAANDAAGAARTVAVNCAQSDHDALVKSPVPPALPPGVKASGTTEVAVTLSPTGHVVRTSVFKSSGNATIDAAVVKAARDSTYAPKVVNCAPVQGSYLFRADFTPKG